MGYHGGMSWDLSYSTPVPWKRQQHVHGKSADATKLRSQPTQLRTVLPFRGISADWGNGLMASLWYLGGTRKFQWGEREPAEGSSTIRACIDRSRANKAGEVTDHVSAHQSTSFVIIVSDLGLSRCIYQLSCVQCRGGWRNWACSGWRKDFSETQG